MFDKSLDRRESEEARKFHGISKENWNLYTPPAAKFELWREMKVAHAAMDSLNRIRTGWHPITPTLVDSTTGVRYSTMDNDTIASILKLNLK